jgi:ubiquinone/menaquinone biosynthesis C-methylase UbiE
MTTTAPTLDLAAIKAKQQVNWSAGNYAVIGTRLQLLGETICDAVDVRAGARVLDVAAGNGNASLAAARRGCDVVALDYVPSLLEQLDDRAKAEQLVVTTEVGDAEALEHPDASFDFVLSTVGVMFAPDQPKAGAEMERVCKPGGRIGLVNWTPDGFVGQMFKILGAYVPPPAGLTSPMAWGTVDRVTALLPNCDVSTTEKQFVFRYRSAQEFLDAFRMYYGPMVKAFEALGDTERDGLAADLVALAQQHNTAGDEFVRLPASYLEVVATRR